MNARLPVIGDVVVRVFRVVVCHPGDCGIHVLLITVLFLLDDVFVGVTLLVILIFVVVTVCVLDALQLLKNLVVLGGALRC